MQLKKLTPLKLFAAGLLCVVVLVWAGGYVIKKSESIPTFVITETGPFTSLDPLDGDNSVNLPVVRMLYATPVENLPDNSLGSGILKSFTYDQKTKVITWILKDDIIFSDGSKILPEDLAFAVARMAYARPKFPVVNLIEGLESWLKNSNPLETLPSGIKVRGPNVQIQLIEDYPHPLFRFSLEIFSVIPKKCVDLKTNKVHCEPIPTSGYYSIFSRSPEEVTFKKRKEADLIQGRKYPNKIRFLYRNPKDVFEKGMDISDGAIAVGIEAQFSVSEIKDIEKKFAVGFTPAAWFTVLQLNAEVEPFKSLECREYFADVFRKTYQRVAGLKNPESSVFTKLVSGYDSYAELRKVSKNLDSVALAGNCRKVFRKFPILWADMPMSSFLFRETMQTVAKELEIPLQVNAASTRKEEIDLYNARKIAVMSTRTGFWALDPSGDIRMLFTPGLHLPLKEHWEDKELHSRLARLVQNGIQNQDAFREINEYLVKNARFNVYGHVRRFYVSSDRNLVNQIPIGLASPAPWQLFEEK